MNKYLFLILALSGCSNNKEVIEYQNKVKCYNEAFAASTGALNLLYYQKDNDILSMSADIENSVNFISLTYKNDIIDCNK